MSSLSIRSFPGRPLPFGVEWFEGRYNFSLYCYRATAVTLLLFERGSLKPIAEFNLDTKSNRTRSVWHIALENVEPHYCYAYRVDSDLTHLFPEQLLLDPYAKGIVSRESWGVGEYHPLGELPDIQEFDWEDVGPPKHITHDLIIYEMHVRGFTAHSSSQVAHPGTYLGMIEKIPHLVKLGVNAVELLPCFEFNECENFRSSPSGATLFNYWGYSTLAFFAPMQRYASSSEPFAAVREFKQLVKELHRNNIEVILDVVFNHTAEGGKQGPLFSFKGLDANHYYMIDEQGEYKNYSGCGNTFNCNHPIAMQFIVDCLRYWALEMHVDGFRFDLASIFSRGVEGEVLPWAPIIEAITTDPLLSKVRLISEAWDAAGLYQVGSFPGKGNWMEWNGRYRDQIRNFIKNTGDKGEFASRLCGSQDMYSNYRPIRSLNYIIAHDGFTLNDLVSYNEKHNENNGEENRDGINQNDSWNCGAEGSTDNQDVIALRNRQKRNYALVLMVSQGVPMWHMGDEYGHTKQGNNNTWCQDNELNWFLWDQLEHEKNYFRFCTVLMNFRNKHAMLKKPAFLSNEDIHWHSAIPNQPKWHQADGFLAFTLLDKQNAEELYVGFNVNSKPITISLPFCNCGKWHWIVNTSKNSPEDIFEEESAPLAAKARCTMAPYSSVMLVSKK